MSNKHIVHVATRLLRGGSEENIIATCIGQVKYGHRVTLVFGRDYDADYHEELDGQFDLECVRSLRHPIRPIWDLRATFEMWRLFRRLRPDLVHTHQSKAGVVGRLASWLSCVPFTVHGVHIAPFLSENWAKRTVYLIAERAMARVTDAFIHVSCGMRDAYAESKIGKVEKHFVVYSGMPLDRFIDADEPTDWREFLDVPATQPKPPVVLMLAALEGRKRHREFIREFDRLVAEIPEVRLVLAGRGEERENIRAEILARGLEGNIKLIGFYPQPEKLVALADVCVLTSNREGLPRVVVQYIAGGKPVVVSHVAGIEEIVLDDVSGFVVDPERIGDAIDAIQLILSDDALREKLTSGALATDVSRWDEHSLVSGTERVYEMLFGNGRASLAAGRRRGLAPKIQ
ncbi:MAG: glycosyltransferase [Pseudomonadota bacterium]